MRTYVSRDKCYAQERLLSLIAGHLLDVNAKQNFSEEQQANMTRNIADAVELLPRLTTGIDVNIMFNDVRGFEASRCHGLSCTSYSPHSSVHLGMSSLEGRKDQPGTHLTYFNSTTVPDREQLLCFAVHGLYCYL